MNPVGQPTESRGLEDGEERPRDEVVQLEIALTALASIDLMAIVGQARRDGLHRPRIAVYDAGPSVDRVRLTCPAIMAVRIQLALDRAPAFTAGTAPSRTSEVALALPLPLSASIAG